MLWLQLTGGEPLIDKLFTAVYQRAFELGMMLSISSNGSRLAQPDILELLTRYRPYRLTISVYGATAEAYDGLTRRRGSFAKFTRGLAAAHEAGLPLNLNLIVTQHNAHELDAMKTLANHFELPHHVFSNMSPTIYGGAESLLAQSQVSSPRRGRRPSSRVVTSMSTQPASRRPPSPSPGLGPTSPAAGRPRGRSAPRWDAGSAPATASAGARNPNYRLRTRPSSPRPVWFVRISCLARSAVPASACRCTEIYICVVDLSA